MTKAALILGMATALCSAGATAAPHPTAQVLDVMRENACRLNTADAESAFAVRGLTPEDVSDVVNGWAEQGLAGLDGPFFEIAPAICGAHGLAAEDTEGRTDALFDFVRHNGCRMGEEEAEIKLRPAGFTKAETPELIENLIADGRARQEDPYIIVIGDAC
ncbi:hypothetical protein [Ruegeria sp.]|uniref:hypothetical protein n=1 Tax=Ruegeria sp. TaxID=1879320 RepID=UPI00231B984B|nr:hypothetical protein [Ruegeria sp.]MDA7963073.1 hypothetical protein [Ruegeria sp.]